MILKLQIGDDLLEADIRPKNIGQWIEDFGGLIKIVGIEATFKMLREQLAHENQTGNQEARASEEKAGEQIQSFETKEA